MWVLTNLGRIHPTGVPLGWTVLNASKRHPPNTRTPQRRPPPARPSPLQGPVNSPQGTTTTPNTTDGTSQPSLPPKSDPCTHEHGCSFAFSLRVSFSPPPKNCLGHSSSMYSVVYAFLRRYIPLLMHPAVYPLRKTLSLLPTCSISALCMYLYGCRELYAIIRIDIG